MSKTVAADTSIVGLGLFGKEIAIGTGGAAATLAAGTALAGSGIPVAAAVGTGVTAVGSGALAVGASAASTLGMTTAASMISGAGAAGVAVGTAVAPFLAPALLIVAPVALLWAIFKDD